MCNEVVYLQGNVSHDSKRIAVASFYKQLHDFRT